MEPNNTTVEIRPIKKLIMTSLILHLLGVGTVLLALLMYQPIVFTFEELLSNGDLAYLSLINFGPDVMMFIFHIGLSICAYLLLRSQKSLRVHTIFVVIATIFVFLMITPLNLTPLTYGRSVYERTQIARELLSFGFTLRDFAVMTFLLPLAMLWYRCFMKMVDKDELGMQQWTIEN